MYIFIIFIFVVENLNLVLYEELLTLNNLFLTAHMSMIYILFFFLFIEHLNEDIIFSF
jgi:hypothetical protein